MQDPCCLTFWPLKNTPHLFITCCLQAVSQRVFNQLLTYVHSVETNHGVETYATYIEPSTSII